MGISGLSVRKAARGAAIAVGVGAMLAVGAPLASAAGADNLGPVATAPSGQVDGVGGKIHWAVVDDTGNLARGRHALSATNVGTGAYIVQFDRNVRACSYTATIGLSGASGTSTRGFITVVGAAAGVDSVFVTTDSTAASPLNLGFHLQVIC